MKYINTADISQGVRAPYSKRTHDHYVDAIKEMAKAAALSHQIDPAAVTILSGLTLSGTGYTEGWVYNQGEVYRVPASSGLTDAASAQLRIKTEWRAGDPVLFTDNNLRNLHGDKVMEVVNATGIGKVSAATRVKIKAEKEYTDTELAKKASIAYTDTELAKKADKTLSWQTVALNTSQYASLTGSVEYTKDDFGRVCLKGSVGGFPSAVYGDITLFTLPAGYRPTAEIHALFFKSSAAFIPLRILTTGEVQIYQDPNNTLDNSGLTVGLSHQSFFV